MGQWRRGDNTRRMNERECKTGEGIKQKNDKDMERERMSRRWERKRDEDE